MRSKNISFADVLKNKSKSPQIEFSKGVMRLSQIMRQFERCPQDDYTLYLRDANLNKNASRPRNMTENQSSMFDSWIQKQSATRNKENMNNQITNRFKSDSNISQKPNINFNAKSEKQHFKLANLMGPNVKKSNSNHIKRGGVQPNLYCEDIDSKDIATTSKQLYQVKRQNSQSNILNYQIQNHPQSRGGREHLRKQLNKITEKKLQEISNLFSKEEAGNFTNNKLQQLIFSTENIHQEIAHLAKEIVKEKNQKSAKQQQLLIQNIELQNRNSSNNTSRQDYETKSNKQNQNDSRWQEAKNMVSNFFNKIKKQKSPNDDEERNKRIQSKPGPSPSENESILHVGFSFAINVKSPKENDQSQQNQLVIDHISEIRSQFMSQRVQDSSDFEFKKYFNPEQPNIRNDHIQNIQSLHFHNDRDRPNTVPNETFTAKLITSQQRSNLEPLAKENKAIQGNRIHYGQKLEIEEIICKNKARSEVHEDSFVAKINPKNTQKLTLISSNKNKYSHQKSNKASPSTSNVPPPQIVTTIFNISPPISENTGDIQSIGNHQKLLSNANKKSIKDVKSSIISPIEQPINSITLNSLSNNIQNNAEISIQKISDYYHKIQNFPDAGARIDSFIGTSRPLNTGPINSNNAFIKHHSQSSFYHQGVGQPISNDFHPISQKVFTEKIIKPFEAPQEITRKYQIKIIQKEPKYNFTNSHIRIAEAPKQMKREVKETNDSISSSQFVFDI